MFRSKMIAAVAIASLGLAACAPPKPPEEERRPQPQAPSTQPQSAIVQAAEAYKERARSAGAQQVDAADAQRAQIEAATQ